MVARCLVAALAAGTAGCGGRQAQATKEQQPFDCKDRFVGYVVSHSMAGQLGVVMDCAEGPRLKRWRVDESGTRRDDARSMTPREFDKLWAEIDASGWQNLKDCSNGTLGKDDPIYKFTVRDDQSQSEFSCQSVSMPFPYNTIVDPLDVAAQRGHGQLGDDEPEDLKKYDQQDKQK